VRGLVIPVGTLYDGPPVPHCYPLMLDVTDRQIVIIGGGGVAARKARGLLDAGAARIRAISPEFAGNMPDAVNRIQKRYDPSDLNGAELVFAATDSVAVNNAVVTDAKTAGTWVCRADGNDELPGDFATPAMLRRGAVIVTISAGSAALSVRIRDGLEQRFDPAWSAMADAMTVIRPLVLASNLDAGARTNLFRELAGDEAMNVLTTSGAAALTQWVKNQLDPHGKKSK
jgi:precorrin-2 dehydrogenase/sirohydrochlorin ferrochelatase